MSAGSAAARGQQGELRLGRRLLDHPHVEEIEAALPGLRVSSFAPVIAYRVERGILSVISGVASLNASLLSAGDDTPALDVEQVVGSDRVLHRLELGPPGPSGVPFTLAVALDNLTFPSANAVALARSLS